MRINHNIAALNASNRLKANDNSISKNLQKLSSGYRINSAADDAAGLAVSEKMRSQINGLSQAEDNAQNGISLVQTAEGGLNETESILQRMNTLAVESANGTYDNSTDRANLNKEVTALKSEVDRISTSTNFNGISLLDGSLSTPTITLSSAVDGDAMTIDPATKGTYGLSNLHGFSASTATPSAGHEDSDTITISYEDENGAMHTTSATLNLSTLGSTSVPTLGVVTGTSGATYTDNVATDGFSTISLGNAFQAELSKDKTFSDQFDIKVDAETGALTFTSKTAGTTGAKVTLVTEAATDNAGANTLTAASLNPTLAVNDGANASPSLDTTKLKVYDGGTVSKSDAIFTVNGQKFAFADSSAHAADLGADVNVVIGANTLTQNMADLIKQKAGLDSTVSTNTISFTSKGQSVSFQIGSDNKDDQRVALSIGDMSTKGLGIENISVATQDDAKAAIDTIKTAINSVSASRSDLGALQNRLEHTTNNLSTMNENLTSAESTIRDVDMSSEMVDLTKNQILEQAATSMLAQANALPQNVLSLLKG